MTDTFKYHYETVLNTLRRYGRRGIPRNGISRDFECCVENGQMTDKTVHAVMQKALNEPENSNLRAGIALFNGDDIKSGRWFETYRKIETLHPSTETDL
jgi:hypothetical protein